MTDEASASCLAPARTRVRLLVGALGVLVGAVSAVACKETSTAVRAGDASTVAAPSASASASAGTPASAGARAGWAYLLAAQPAPSPSAGDVAAKATGPWVTTLVAVDPAGAVGRVEVPGAMVARVHRASDGQAYALAGSKSGTVQVLRLSGRALETVAEVPGCGRPTDETAFDVRGDRVVVHCGRAGLLERRGGGAWTTLDVPGEGIFASAWISKSGTLWFGAADGLHERTGATWSAKAFPAPPTSEPIDFFDGPDGVYVTVRSSGLLRIRGERLEQVWPNKPGARVLWASSNGTTGSLDEFAPSLRLDTLASAGTAAPVKRALSHRSSVDDRGRVWGVKDGSLLVANAQTGDVDVVPMGAYAELDYIETQRIVVLGDGPQVPAPKLVRRTKRITMRLAPDGKAAASADVELCPRRFSSSMGRASPCAGVDASLVFRTKTDAKGEIVVDDVPMGTYYVHWKAPGDAGWQRDLYMVPLREDEVSNAGAITRSPQRH